VFMDEGKVLFRGTLREAKSAGIAKMDEFFKNG